MSAMGGKRTLDVRPTPMHSNRERFANRTDQTMIVQVEPLGEIYEVKPGSELSLSYDLANEMTADTLTVDYATKQDKAWISVWVHSEDYPLVFLDGELVGSNRS